MKFYESSIRLRITVNNIYGIHQHLDAMILGKMKMKLPYSFSFARGSGDDSLIMLRTAQPLDLPGERERNIVFTKGQSATISGSIALIRREVVADRKREVTPPPGEINDFVIYRLSRSGFSPLEIVVDKPKRYLVHKDTGDAIHRICIPASRYKASGIINSVEDFELALVFGIGRKRVFGFGFISEIR